MLHFIQDVLAIALVGATTALIDRHMIKSRFQVPSWKQILHVALWMVAGAIIGKIH